MEQTIKDIHAYFTRLTGFLPSNLSGVYDDSHRLKPGYKSQKMREMSKSAESCDVDEDPAAKLNSVIQEFKAKRNKNPKSKRRPESVKTKPKALERPSTIKAASLNVHATAAPKYNATGRTLFSKFDLIDPLEQAAAKEAKMKKKKKGKGLASELVGSKDARKELAQLEARQEKIQELAKEDPEKAQEFRQKVAWTTALLRAEGERVKDDKARLKKTAKRMEKKKEKSRRDWEKREETVKKQKEKRQEKRQNNLRKRRDVKFSNKVKKLVKKGRILPELQKS